MRTGLIRVLLVEDDEDDYVLTRELFSEMPGCRVSLDWTKTFESGLQLMARNQHDLYLVDFRLGARSGLELLRDAIKLGCQAPIILLTGSGQHEVDVDAMKAGAADYLVKSQLRADTLERTMRYALQRRRAAAFAAFEQARLAAFGAEVGLALTRPDSLPVILNRCAAAMEQYLGAALAQIATFEPQKQTFNYQAAAGTVEPRTSPALLVPAIQLDPVALAKGESILITDLASDSRLSDPDWARQEGLCSYAAHPLVLEDRLIGLMSVFTQQPVSPQIIQEMGSVANGVALCIERKRSAEALDASEVKYRSVVETIKEVIFQLDGFGNWTFLNPAWSGITGFDVQSTLGTFFLDYVHPEERERNRQIFLRLVQQQLDECRHETRLLTRDGRVRWVEFYGLCQTDSGQGLLGISGTLTDITERKQSELAIRKLAAFPQVNPNPVLEFAPDGTLNYANEAARQLATALDQADLWAVLPAESSALVIECLRTGNKRLNQQVIINGHTLSWSFFPVISTQVVHCYGADVTDVLTLEAQFRHAQKLESIGQLAAGVAHDFNNLLTVIQGYADAMLARTETSSPNAKPLRQISDAARRAAGLTRQLLTFSRKQVIEPQPLDLNGVLRNMANMLPRLLTEDIALETGYTDGLPRIEADNGMMEQIVMNLAVNARDAMPNGGRMLLTTDEVILDQAGAQRHPAGRPGRFVRLSVVDTGCGMDRKTLDRIFEPFFTTKGVGKGTGLGLATVYGIVQQHQGWIEVESAPGRGTSFTLFFPALKAAIVAETSSKDQETSPRGTETILLVEDEPVLREMAAEVLRQCGYTVLEAGSGAEALQVWDRNDGKIDLALTDMVMPGGLNGAELAAQLRKRQPSLRTMFSSGYSAELRSPGTTWFLPKPYSPPQLARMVRQCLDASLPAPPLPVAIA